MAPGHLVSAHHIPPQAKCDFCLALYLTPGEFERLLEQKAGAHMILRGRGPVILHQNEPFNKCKYLSILPEAGPNKASLGSS